MEAVKNQSRLESERESMGLKIANKKIKKEKGERDGQKIKNIEQHH